MREPRLTPLKFIGEIVSGGTPKSYPENWGGPVPFVTPPDLNGVDGGVVPNWERSLTESGTAGSAVVSNAVLLSCRAPIGHVGVVTDLAAFNQGCKAIVPERPEDLRYLGHVLVAYRAALQAAGRGTTFLELSTTELAAFQIPWPTPDMRERIANYLNRETGEINAMIAKLDELTETLRDRLVGEAHRVLAPWFAKDTQPIWSVMRPIKDQNHPAEEVLSVYRDYGVIPKASRDDNHNRTPENLTTYQLVEPGDVVINKMKAWQGSLGVSAYRGIVSPDYQVACPDSGVNSRYLHSVLRSRFMIPQYKVHSTGVRPSQWRLYWAEFANLHIPVPTANEQKRIADHLDEVTGRVDQMLAKVTDLKNLLLKRRAALITDVVTGRKDIA
ncbi:restriction endonuclease subunit S [Streptomyces sp. NBC_01760]|uniref:restriction endonuclease subunit S n=1 Tax=Streptomyces sp. NBC_01760 TaxID=2975931 RepID=UPI002DDBBE3B|nr:restriction endonuclease subunit S [Streptomyces sp. NBC_01760]WSC72189.1 restriction endonuclease subunit S [Streptomyces sp. NBC_01760]